MRKVPSEDQVKIEVRIEEVWKIKTDLYGIYCRIWNTIADWIYVTHVFFFNLFFSILILKLGM